ncbi:thioredoxin family protein [Sediminispirochaeta smaragdinae]|uniref:Thioredoxin domain protein n=1 Tax=Sediminispirochaeta smaragdinae (strain DSM 11293 / JCM 15392 / SEBR 4228) TaxID=573413 RepID=E1R7F2_SEDSS|nr:thioredoxin family protein [Sediminispirochaeta smaragdinae]ADK82657.1 Thioredoxin domain protein [Sediminispirochaeta smaragdinae DSM 11293]
MNLLIGVLIAIGFFFVLQYGMVLKMRMKKGKPAPELSGKYDRALKNGGAALFYFYSDGCGACKPMTPLFDEFSSTRKNVFKVNISNDMATARKFGVMGTPSTVLVRDGKIAEFLVGPQPRERIEALLPGR